LDHAYLASNRWHNGNGLTSLKNIKRVTIYASLGLRRGIPELLWAFRKKFVLQEFPVYLDDHPFQIYQRIKEEEEHGMKTADIVMLPHYMLLKFKKEGLLSPYAPADLQHFSSKFVDSEKMWFALGITFMTMAYNSAKIRKAQLPKSLEELVFEKWNGRLGMQSLVSSSVGNLGAQYIGLVRRIVGEDRWLTFLEGIKKSDVKTFDCIDHLVQGLLDKKIDIALTVYSLAYFRERIAKAPVRSFQIDDVPRMLTFTSAGLTRSGRDNESAKTFLDYLASKEAQRIIGTIPGISPARSGIKTTYDFEASYSSKSSFHPDNEDVKELPEIIDVYKKIGLP
jgi:iron(III) transport system substrate-binding protein